MNVKTFEGSTMAEALAKVKGALGADAVILHTRSRKRGGIMGFMSRDVVEITASADVNIARKRKARQDNDSREGTARERAAQFAKKHVVASAYGSKPPVDPNDSAAGMLVNPSRPAERFASTREMAAATLKDPAFEVRTELAGLRTMVESLLQRTARIAGERPDLPGELARAYTTLIEQQVADEIAIRVVNEVRDELTPEQLANAATVRERLVARLAALLPAHATSEVARPVIGNDCRSICLIGPTGVGKTTTIAKLAAAFKLRQRLKVGLITIDTYRIAAVDQLRTYANIIGVPLKVVLTPQELADAMAGMQDCDVVLIDTAGRSPTDELKLNELQGFIDAAKPSEVHLVLSSTTTQKGLESAIEKFGRLRVDQIIFTKLDEAVSFGILLNVARRASKALSYITTGQDVPDHVEPGQPRRLARLILGERL